jgi:hypothetical protein
LVTLAAVAAVGGSIQPGASAQDAPLFTRPFDGVPTPREAPFTRIVPPEQINSDDDDLRHLDAGGGPDSLPPHLPPRFTDRKTTPATTGMTAGGAFFGQFIDHDLTDTRLRFDELLMEPFVFRYFETPEGFQNRRVPGFDLDSLYRLSPLDFPSTPDNLGPWDLSNLRFRFGFTKAGNLDFIRFSTGEALIGDVRNDQNGVVSQIHRAFMQLHNLQVDRVIEREEINEQDVEYLSQTWWDIFNEARNYTTAYYQGIVANEYVVQLTGRTLFEAMDATDQPLGPIADPAVAVELAGSAFRLHTTIPVSVQLGPDRFASPIGAALREGVPWPFLYGPGAPPAARLDLAVAAPLRRIVNLMIPGTLFPITLDLAQVNILRGREMRLPSGEEYLAFLMEELELDPRTETIRGKLVLTDARAAEVLDPERDADLLADLASDDTDLWAYVQLEAEVNDGSMGPVGQDIVERNWAGLLLADDWSLVGALADQFTPEQMAFFRSATFDRLLDEILSPADLDRDGRVSTGDLLALLAAWGPCPDPCPPSCAADLDEDCVVGTGDLLLLLEAWGF